MLSRLPESLHVEGDHEEIHHEGLGYEPGTFLATLPAGLLAPSALAQPYAVGCSPSTTARVAGMYDGQVWTDAAGYATVTLPNSVTGLNMGFHYQLTVLDDGDSAALVQA